MIDNANGDFCRYYDEAKPIKGLGGGDGRNPGQIVPCVHYVGFRDDRYWNARRIWGGPAFIHRWWDKRAAREIADCDTVIFADGDWRQEPRKFNAPDITEDAP